MIQYLILILFLFIFFSFLINYFHYKNILLSTEKNIKKIRHSSKIFPPPFPNTWYFVDYSNNVRIGDVKPFSLSNKEMVIFRNRNNKIGILHAFCPHLGTHLGYGGKVINSCIVCPYHSW